MIRFHYISLIFCLILALSLSACDRDEITLGTVAEGIQVIGTGSVFSEPDIAVLNLGISVQEKNIEDATDNAAFTMEQVLESVKMNGIADSDIQTRQFNIRPVYNYINNQRVLDGYEVSNNVSIKARDIDALGKIIDDSVTAGGKWTVVNSIGFDIDDPKPLQEQAREEAMKDALAKAETLAELGGVTLGKPISISENVSGVPSYDIGYGGMTARDEASTPIESGELEVIVTLAVVYDIE